MRLFEKLIGCTFRLWWGCVLGFLMAAGALAQTSTCAERFAKDPAFSPLFDGNRLKTGGWVRRPESDTVLVFVHGIFSNNQAAWLNGNEALGCPYWPQMVANDPAFAYAGVFVAGYYTGVASGNFDIDEAARQLLTTLSLPSGNELYAPLQYPNLIFVAHSLGGIVTRRLLSSESKVFSQHKLGLVLMASPSRGSGWADRAAWFAKTLGNQMAQQLRPDDPLLEEIHESFIKLVRAKPKILDIEGTEQFENLFLQCDWAITCIFASMAPRNIVKETDGGYYFGAPEVIPQTDHWSIVKPGRPDDLSHQRLKQFFSSKFAFGLRPYKDDARQGALSLEGTRPVYGWRLVDSVDLSLIASSDSCESPPQAGCSESLQALPPISQKPALGNRRWVAANPPVIHTLLGPQGSYSFEEIQAPLPGAEGLSTVTVTATRKSSEKAVVRYTRRFRLEEYAEIGRDPYQRRVQLCTTFQCRFKVEVDSDVLLTRMVEDLPLGLYPKPWDSSKPLYGKAVRLTGLEQSPTTSRMEFMVIPDFAGR